jgi:hypothetical protein
MPDCLGPFIGDIAFPDVAPFDFVVISAIDGIVPNKSFNVFLDKAYRAGKPVIATVRIDTSYYSVNTLGFWPPEGNDKVYNLMKKMFIMPDGSSRYSSISAVLIDMRNYYGTDGKLVGGAWIMGVVKHIRDWLTKAGFKSYILTDARAVALYPDPAGAVATALSQEKTIAVQQNEQNNPKLSIPWAPSAFLWWYGTKFIGDTATAMFRCIFVKEELYKFLGFKPTVVYVPPVVIPTVPPIVVTNNPTEIQLLQSIDLRLSKIMSKLGI